MKILKTQIYPGLKSVLKYIKIIKHESFKNMYFFKDIGKCPIILYNCQYPT